nr:MAG TPA: hypothetical protein [Caudoviricetes sp.]
MRFTPFICTQLLEQPVAILYEKWQEIAMKKGDKRGNRRKNFPVRGRKQEASRSHRIPKSQSRRWFLHPRRSSRKNEMFPESHL